MDIPQDLRRAALPYSRVTIFNSCECRRTSSSTGILALTRCNPGSASTMSSCPTRTLRIFSRSAVRIEFSHPGPD